MVKGKGVSKGIGIGHTKVLKNEEVKLTDFKVENKENELKYFKKCLSDVIEDTKKVVEKLSGTEADIMNAYLMILQDPTLTEETERLIQEDGYNAGYATKVGFETVEEVFKNMDDEYMSARASDIEDMKNKVVNKIIDKAYTLYNTYVEYKGYKKLYNTFDTTINLKDNIRITLSPKENLIISGKILYWQTIRSKKVNTAYCKNYAEFKKLWNNTITRKQLKDVIRIKFNEYLDNQKAIEEAKAKKYREELEVLIQEFRNYKISSIPYQWRQYGTYAVMRYESTNGVVRLWNDAVIKLKDFTGFAHFFATCVQNNIQLNRKTCYNYKIQFGGYYVWEVQANDLWNVMWGGQCITIMDVIIICNRIGISLEECKVTRKQLLSQFEKRQEM